MSPTMPPDSNQISLKIIEAVRQHPVLYCTEVKGISARLQEFKQKVWCRISDELGLDSTFVRLKWKNLRDTYCRILKIKSKTEDGPRKKKWIFEDSLNFLKFPYEPNYKPQCVELTEEYMQDINSGGMTPQGLLEQLEDRTDEDYSEYLEVLEENTADPIQIESDTIEMLDGDEHLVAQNLEAMQDASQQEADTYVEQIQSKYRKIRPKRIKLEHSPVSNTSGSYNVTKSPFKTNNANTFDATAITSSFTPNQSIASTSVTSKRKRANSVKESDNSYGQVYLAPETKSSIELFFDSMAQTVKKLPPKAQADIKMNICKIVTEAEVRYSGQGISQSTQQFIAPPGMIPKLVLIPCSMVDNENTKNN